MTVQPVGPRSQVASWAAMGGRGTWIFHGAFTTVASILSDGKPLGILSREPNLWAVHVQQLHGGADVARGTQGAAGGASSQP